MSQLNHELVRAEHAYRVEHAQEGASAHRLARLRRLSRKAERAAGKARRDLARSL